MSVVQRACDRIIHGGIVGLAVFTPLAFGTVEPWAITLMEWGIVTLVLVFCMSRLWPGAQNAAHDSQGGLRQLAWLAVPIGLFIVLCILQTVPLPVRWLRTVSPGSALQYEAVDLQTWERVEDGAAEARSDRSDPVLKQHAPGLRPISVNPRRTLSMALLLATLVALFFLVALWADEVRAISLLRSLTIVGFLVSLFGLAQLLTWNGKIYWVRKIRTISATSPAAFGPFVNHDHFAGYVEMVIPVAISLAFWLVDSRRATFQAAVRGLGAESGTARIGDGAGETRARFGKAALAFFAAIILIVSLFLSLSRGGILSAVISGTVLLVLLCRRAASRALRWSVVLALPTIVTLLIAWIGAQAVRSQLESYGNISGEASLRLRAIIWGRVVRELPSYLWFGSGLGTFEDSFSPLTPAGSLARWDRAHNDYLQLVWETGVVGGALFLVGAGLFIRRTWWPALRGYRRPVDLFRVGMAVSLMSIAIHSVVDFCLQIGANAFLCALLAGLLLALHRTGRGLAAARSPAPAVAESGAE